MFSCVALCTRYEVMKEKITEKLELRTIKLEDKFSRKKNRLTTES